LEIDLLLGKQAVRLEGRPGLRAHWTWKQKLKYRLMQTPFIGVAYFFGSYVLMGGFRDGFTGLAFAIVKMSYFTQVYCKLREGAAGQRSQKLATD
jgi:hypothetical protein